MTTRAELMSEPLVGLDPTTHERLSEPSGLATRPGSLQGLQVGLVTNGLQDEMMQALGKEIVRRTGAAGLVPVSKHGISVPPEPADWSRLTAEARVAITGYGG